MSDQKLIIGYYRLSMEDDSEGESNSIINPVSYTHLTLPTILRV